MKHNADIIKGHVTASCLQDDGLFPNNEKLTALLYKGAIMLHPDDEAECIIETFKSNNWTNAWVNGIYDYHHYHSNTHEALGIFSGTALVQLGGDHGTTVELTRGDLIVIPAGVAHKCLKASDDFSCVGAYPEGRFYNMNYGKPEERERALQDISEVPLPDMDPVYGEDGPLREHW